MAKMSRQVENLFLKLSGSATSDLVCLGARVCDQLSKIPELRMEIASTASSFAPNSFLGTHVTLEANNGFKFSGVVISIEDLGHQDSMDLFAAEVRPWFWLLTIGSDNRVFQGMSTPEIVKAVMSHAGFTDVTDGTTATYDKRDYCVQYGESDFDFVCRLMEEDGIYYFFDHSGTTEKIVLADSVSAHSNNGTVPYTASNQVGERQADSDSIFEWAEVGRVFTGKVSLFDYDMTKPSADLKVHADVGTGGHSYSQTEHYRATGHYQVAGKGEDQARQEAEGYAASGQRSRGLSNAAKIVTGAIFTLEHADRDAVEGDYLVTRATHYMMFNPGFGAENSNSLNRHVERIEYPAEMALFETEFEVQKSAVQFRPPKVTPWPQVPSLLTAKVTGPSGEEIYTDEYGRIKVMFPWDRIGKSDEATSIWVRSVMPWGGKDWGMFSVPRIGMEVIIQFERGNIDRPYCTGVVYNGTNKPPYALPGDMTKTGIRTNSSKGGGGFHELTFEDKKDAESIFFQSEKDYKQIVKNDAVITIGMEKKDKGDLTQTIYRHKTETLKEGDLTQVVEKGSRITKIKKDHTETIEGKSATTITGDTELTIKDGKKAETVATGSSTIDVSKGDFETTVGKGNIKIDATAGSIKITAGMEITLAVGASKITIGPSGVKIEGATLSLDAKAMSEVKGAVVKVAGSGMVEVQGGMVKIN